MPRPARPPRGRGRAVRYDNTRHSRATRVRSDRTVHAHDTELRWYTYNSDVYSRWLLIHILYTKGSTEYCIYGAAAGDAHVRLTEVCSTHAQRVKS